MRLRIAAVLTAAALLAGCTQFPDLDSAITPAAATAPYPALIPVEDLQAQVPDARIGDDAADGIEARVARLKARAARLRGSVIDSPTRARMQAGVSEG